MSLISTLRSGVETAFSVANELVRVGEYRAKGGDPVYDADTDSMSTSGDVRLSGVRMIFTSTDEEEREASPVSVSDSKVLIPYVDMKGVTPTETGVIVVGGVTYNIVQRKPIPGEAIYVVIVREA